MLLVSLVPNDRRAPPPVRLFFAGGSCLQAADGLPHPRSSPARPCRTSRRRPSAIIAWIASSRPRRRRPCLCRALPPRKQKGSRYPINVSESEAPSLRKDSYTVELNGRVFAMAVSVIQHPTMVFFGKRSTHFANLLVSASVSW